MPRSEKAEMLRQLAYHCEHRAGFETGCTRPLGHGQSTYFQGKADAYSEMAKKLRGMLAELGPSAT